VARREDVQASFDGGGIGEKTGQVKLQSIPILTLAGNIDLASHMTTTVHIPDNLLRDARQIAQREGITLKALVQEGLRRMVDEHKKQKPFRLRKATFNGSGMDPELQQAPWERIRDMSYDGRGG
jgi:hypothetical protein